MATLAEEKITPQTFFDLGYWLSNEKKINPEQLSRIQEEKHYVPLISLTNHYWLIGRLSAQLKFKNVWEQLPQQLQAYLTEIEKIYAQRAHAIQQEVLFTHHILSQENIPVIILKGASHLFNGIAHPASTRFMRDIDLLLPENKIEFSYNLLKSKEYQENAGEFDVHAVDHHHAQALIRPQGVCYVELHRWPLKKTFSGLLTTKEAWKHSVPLALEKNIKTLQLSPTHQIILTITHSELSDNAYKDEYLELQKLYDLYAISTHFSQEIEWKDVALHFKRSGKTAILHASLFAVYKLFGLVTPISDRENALAHQHFERCLKRYCKYQGQDSFLTPLTSVLRGYSKEIIFIVYGGNNVLSLWRGRFKHFKRHMRMLKSKNYLSKAMRLWFKPK